jgi:hypothetical protein
MPYHLSHNPSPFLVLGIFEIGSCELFAQDWLWTLILLISASWVARLTGISYWDIAVMSVLTSGLFIVKKWIGLWLKFTLGKVLLFVLIPGIIHCFYSYTVLSFGPKDFKVGLLTKFGSLRHRYLNMPLNKGWVLSDAPFKTILW